MPIPLHIKNNKIIILLILTILIIGISLVTSTNTKETKQLSDVAVGDFFTHYQKTTELKEINKFYESIKTFSQNTIRECQNAQNKDECVQTKIQNAKTYNLEVNNCQDQTKTDAINLQEIKQQNQELKDEENNYGFHTIQGQVNNIIVEQQPTLIINQPNNKIINITFKTPAGITELRKSKDQYIKVEGVIYEINTQTQQIKMRIGKIGESGSDWQKYITINPSAQQSTTLINTAKQIANCANSQNQTCLCEITFPKEYTEINFEKDNFYINEENKYHVPTLIRTQNLAIKNKIIAYKKPTGTIMGPEQEIQETEDVFSFDMDLTELEIMILEENLNKNINLTKREHKIQFKKNNDELIIIDDNTEPNLKMCEIQTKTYLFCAEYKDPNNHYKETKPQMNFALKI